MKQYILALIFVFGIISISCSQDVVSNSDRGYYIKNNQIVKDIAIEKANQIQRSEKVVIPNQIRHSEVILYPDDIQEYGFPNEHRYISAEIMIYGNAKKVFMEEITHLDSIIVYFYPMSGNDLFFLQQGDNLLQLVQDEEEFWNLFRNSACPEITEFINSNKKKKLSYGTINAYRKAYTDCNINLFQKFRLGVTTEIGFLKPGINIYTDYKYHWDFSFLVGLFAQIPLDECFSFHPELLYSYISTPDKQLSGTVQKPILGKSYIVRESFQLPMVFRYNFNYIRGKLIPYIDLGLLLDAKIRKDPGLWVNDEVVQNTKVNPFQYGMVLGGGIEYKLNTKHSVYTGLTHIAVHQGGNIL